jgi:hypothetical protein
MRTLPLILLVASVASAEESRVIKFATGSATVDSHGGTDHVVVKDTTGKVTSESSCETGTYDAYVTLFTKLKDAVAGKDRRAVLKLVAFPFRMNGPNPIVFRDEASLAKGYDTVFTPKVVERIRQAEPAAVFCRNGEGMLGDGVIWATPSNGAAAATVTNP